MFNELRVAVLPGDGIGSEVIPEAVKVLQMAAECSARSFRFTEAPIGGAAIEACGEPLPADTLKLCLESDAVLLGAVGDPRWDHNPPEKRPEVSLLRLRKELGTFANLRPSRCFEALMSFAPLKEELIRGTDILVVRELTGGLYYGEPRGFITGDDGQPRAVNTMAYSWHEIERIACMAFELAAGRRRRLVSVDKANVLEVSQLWRRVVDEVAAGYPDVTLEHLFVDNCAMAMVTRPRDFDVLLTENTFGDILSDEASVLTGSLGLLPSACLGGKVDLYEPVHGTAPDIAGRGIANPIGAILSGAMLLRHSADLDVEARAVERAVDSVLEQGYRTHDIATRGCIDTTTRQMGDLITSELECMLESPLWQV